MTEEEKIKYETPNEMEEQMNAKTKVYISKEHQQNLALEDDEISEETHLTKESAALPATTNNTFPKDDLLALTGSTRESRVKLYVDSVVKKLYHSILILLPQYNRTLEKRLRIEELEKTLRQMQHGGGDDLDLSLDSKRNTYHS